MTVERAGDCLWLLGKTVNRTRFPESVSTHWETLVFYDNKRRVEIM